ncbi:LuxR C-terminal-related transcriptional regulator [Actinomadura hibisca]|uniref:LuxR C-terminal-related transcriptional regulator n=1 Tax=Actinomadura hibisca TaxID=68565 RepID=UPI000ACA8BC9|nr:sigma factor-like helix-turn-helix DNA-binding protein [Actinomadura hibisca]
MAQIVFVDDHLMVVQPLVAWLIPHLAARGHRMLPPAADVTAVGPAGPSGGVAVCDVVLKVGPSGSDAVRHLRGLGWRVLLLSGHAPAGQVLEAVAEGAHGYVEKSQPSEELAAAIETVAAGRLHLSSALADLFYGGLRASRLPPGRELTSVDRDVLKSFVQGRTEAEAAALHGLTTARMQGFLSRAFAANRARRALLSLSDREREVLVAIGCRDLDAEAAARALHMSANTLNTHLRNIRAKYRTAFPDLAAGLTQRQTARRLALDLNLCGRTNHQNW